MWVIAGVLLGLVVLVSLTGFHTGPQAHLLAGALGIVAAAWIVAMAANGRSAPVLWALLSSDLVVSAGVGALAYKGFSGRRTYVPPRHRVSPEAAQGVAVSDLAPNGLVRVRGETWSAVSVNGTVRSGAPIQVLRAEGVRLEVWGEEPMFIEDDPHLERQQMVGTGTTEGVDALGDAPGSLDPNPTTPPSPTTTTDSGTPHAGSERRQS
jgi:membrane-bound ClpP family serine protease